MAKVEQKHLEGLVFRTVKTAKGEDGKKKYVPQERPLTIEDLLAQADKGDTFVVVTKNGRKHVIQKAPVKGAKAGKEE